MKDSLKKYVFAELAGLFLVVMAVIIVCAFCISKKTLETRDFMTDEITIYSDGYYGRTLDQPLKITDKKEQQAVIKAACDPAKYKKVEDENELEGNNGIWVDFHNGTVIGMYPDKDYGNVGATMETTGPGSCYELPKELRKQVISLLEKYPVQSRDKK